MKTLYSMLIGLALSGYACNKKSILDSKEKVGSAPNVIPGVKEPSDDPKSPPIVPKDVQGEDEQVDAPQNISGATLTCSYELKTEADDKALVGCRVDGKDGVRIVGKSLSSSFSYTHNLPSEASDVAVISRTLASDNRYDVLFLVRSPSGVVEKVASMSVAASFPGTAQGNLVFDGTLSEILKDSNQLPEPRAFVYPAAVDRMIQDSQAGISTPLNLDPIPNELVAKGSQLYATYCQSCHGIKGSAETNVRNSSKESITASIGTTAQMESLRGQFTIDEIQAIEAYLK